MLKFSSKVVLLAAIFTLPLISQEKPDSSPLDSMKNVIHYRSGPTCFKDLASHFGLMGTSGLHVVSVAYRGRGDMTIWINGRGRTDNLALEWSALYAGSTVDDGGITDAATDATVGDAPVLHDMAPAPDGVGGEAGAVMPTKGGDKCGCAAGNGGGGLAPLGLLVAVVAALRRRSRRCR